MSLRVGRFQPALPAKYQHRLKSTNMRERLIQVVRQRERVIRILPNEEATLRLIGALLAEIHEWWEASVPPTRKARWSAWISEAKQMPILRKRIYSNLGT